MVVVTIFIFLLSYEAIMWGWTLNRHATWLDKHIRDRRSVLVSFNALKLASMISSFVSIAIWSWWLFVVSTISTSGGNIVLYAIIAIIAQASHIHFSVMLAKYSCLPRSFWSMISKYVSVAMCHFFKFKEPILTSEDLYICWGHDFDKC